MKHLPLGIQHFEVLREKNSVYIDKTEYVHDLMDMGGAYFLSRPRRFGKSLFLSTIKELAHGRQNLFVDTWIADKWDWSRQYPVLHFSFTSIDFQGEGGLEGGILYELKQQYRLLGVRIPKNLSMKQLFGSLITELHRKHGKIVLLIDEYDKPIIEYLEFDKMPKAHENQDILRAFYSVLKDLGYCLHLVFITGVSKFSKVSLFSDLNHLTDLTMMPSFATAFGYTQTDLEAHFQDYLAHFITKNPQYTIESLLEKIKLWYNGFSWDGTTSVYNPFGLLTFFRHGQFRNFWFQSGTPRFLIERMKLVEKFDWETVTVQANFLDKYDLENTEINALLFQTGYLTIKKEIADGLILGFPNQEVRDSMYSSLLYTFTSKRESSDIAVDKLAKAFDENNLERVEEILQNMFQQLPYDVFPDKMDDRENRRADLHSEALLHGIIHILFKYLGVKVESEVHTARGRADAIVFAKTHIFIFEFKIGKTAAEAMEQLKTRNYAAKYTESGKKITLIAMNFDKKYREWDEWLLCNYEK
jgi:hypothetical protein